MKKVAGTKSYVWTLSRPVPEAAPSSKGSSSLLSLFQPLMLASSCAAPTSPRKPPETCVKPPCFCPLCRTAPVALDWFHQLIKNVVVSLMVPVVLIFSMYYSNRTDSSPWKAYPMIVST